MVYAIVTRSPLSCVRRAAVITTEPQKVLIRLFHAREQKREQHRQQQNKRAASSSAGPADASERRAKAARRDSGTSDLSS